MERLQSLDPALCFPHNALVDPLGKELGGCDAPPTGQAFEQENILWVKPDGHWLTGGPSPNYSRPRRSRDDSVGLERMGTSPNPTRRRRPVGRREGPCGPPRPSRTRLDER